MKHEGPVLGARDTVMYQRQSVSSRNLPVVGETDAQTEYHNRMCAGPPYAILLILPYTRALGLRGQSWELWLPWGRRLVLICQRCYKCWKWPWYMLTGSLGYPRAQRMSPVLLPMVYKRAWTGYVYAVWKRTYQFHVIILCLYNQTQPLFFLVIKQ